MNTPTLPEREPVALIMAAAAAVSATITLLAAFGLTITEAQRDAILATGISWAVLLVVLIPLVRSYVTPRAAVVERVTPAGVVVAGEASELPTGTPVREMGTLDPAASTPLTPARHAVPGEG